MSEDFYKGRKVWAAIERADYKAAETTSNDEVDPSQLKSYIERIETANETLDEAKQDVKEIYGEAKAMGFDVKVLRKVIAIRKLSREERAEMEAVLDVYLSALGE